MIDALTEYGLPIAEEVSARLGDCLQPATTRWITGPPAQDAVRDATYAFYVDGRMRAQDMVLLVSGPAFPEAVGEDGARARQVADRVSAGVAGHIATPLATGRFEGQSWAAFARLSPMASWRGARMLQKPRIAGPVLDWLAQLARETQQPETTAAGYEARFVHPLEVLALDHDLSDPLRRFAQDCRDRLLRDRPALVTVVQHGDFWVGNILFRRRRWPTFNPALGDFCVIDWRGARLDGYPCADAIRLISSLYRVNAPQTGAFLDRYLKALALAEADMALYSLLSLGQLGENLDQFPKARYCQLCEETYRFLQVRGAAGG